QRTPQDEIFKPLLKSIFTGLEQADILGSLLRPREYLDSAIADLLKPQTMELAFNPEMVARRRDIIKLAEVDPTGLRNTLLETIANSFKVEAGNTSDVSVALFGREAEQGMRLLQILDRQYAVVVTNPPYLGSRNMEQGLKKYVEKHYPTGRRDLYTVFMLRSLELCRYDGRIAMVTMQSWMFLRSYADIRVLSNGKLPREGRESKFAGILKETSIEAIAHLGRYAFSEIDVPGSPLLFTLKAAFPTARHQIWASRLTARKPAEEQAALLVKVAQLGQLTGMCYVSRQIDFLSILESPVVYWLRPHFLELLRSSYRLVNVATVKVGLQTSDNERFLRCNWEVNSLGIVSKGQVISGRWFGFAKGGGYCKWVGLEWLYIDWQYEGIRLKHFPSSVLRSPEFYFKAGLTYTVMARGNFAARMLDNAVFDTTGTSIFPTNTSVSRIHLASLTSARIVSYLLRVATQDIKFSGGYVVNLPLSQNLHLELLHSIGQACIAIKQKLVSGDLVECRFDKLLKHELYITQSIIHTLEGINEKVVNDAYELDEQDVQAILEDTGIPAGWYPLITGYDTLPSLPDNVDIPQLPQVVFDYLAEHKRIMASDKELARIKNNLKALYVAGPDAKGVEQEESEETAEEGEKEMASGAHIPIPTETFLEELSVKMALHPISVYWLLEELRAEGVRCLPEEKRLLEDRLSVLVLRLLGHRWPKQLEAGELVPTWADEHGIIPLVPGTGRATLAERVRERLQMEDGALETQKTEALLHELTGKTLELWLRSNFFAKHIQQFKSRPIAWHLASTPIKDEKIAGSAKKRRGTTEPTTRGPAFECLLYYHACSRSALTRIRTQYVEPLLQAERDKVEQGGSTRFASNDGAIPFAKLRIRELEDFVARLQQIEESGFETPELQMLLADEPLDRWSGDGLQAPKNADALYRAEKAWHVDINDGVRVNIAPLQLAGVLTGVVLAKSTDAKKALIDRSRWRADERRW
ncbi:MAG: Eco57I restriction-modification methylase domain-containing protein, partial [Ktedonobacteraceae bacterium]